MVVDIPVHVSGSVAGISHIDVSGVRVGSIPIARSTFFVD
jgi:hypothetical protein